MIDLSGQTTLISGSVWADGIMQSFQAAGATVHHHDETLLDPLEISASLTSFDQINTIIILPTHYNTGFFMETTPADWDAALQKNYERAVYVSQAAAQHMIDHKVAGNIIFISTIHMPMMQTSVYGTSLAALYPLAKMAAVECGQYGIRVNTITTGWIDSERIAHYDEVAREYIKAGIPLGEIGKASDLGEACCFLASAQYITGGIIPVDGGYALTRSDGTSPYPTSHG